MAVSFQTESAAPFNRYACTPGLLEQRREAWVTGRHKLRSVIKRCPPHPSRCHSATYSFTLVDDKHLAASFLQGGRC
jgi:hypothetical protein